MRRKKWTAGLALLAVTAIAPIALVATPVGAASTPGVTSKTITLGLITSLTGGSGPEDVGIIPAAQARIDQQNAAGGIDGRKITLITRDDQTSPATNETDTSELLSQGVFGVIDLSALAFAGYKILQQAGVPVTGGAYDGPEWFEQPNTNMFSFTGPGDAKDPQYSGLAVFAKQHGGTRCGSIGYSISPSSQASASGFDLACQRAGMTNAFLDTSVAFGSVNTTTLALELKAAKVNTLWLPLDEVTNFALMTSLNQAGVKMKVIFSATGYGQTLIDDTSAVADAQGVWFTPTGAPVELKTPATKAFEAALAKYAHFKGIPDFAWYEGWGAADLMIKGLELAGKNPTRPAFISGLHKVANYDDGGLETPVNLTLSHFGKAPSTLCEYLTQFEGRAFVHSTKVCGTILSNSDQLPSA
jgi:ABC-type branched-subunit amino acid transport system substrate-binding protein